MGVRIVAPLETNPNESFALNIYKNEVVKIIAHFSKSSSVNSMICFYTLRNCAQYIRSSLKMTEVEKHLDGGKCSCVLHIYQNIVLHSDL